MFATTELSLLANEAGSGGSSNLYFPLPPGEGWRAAPDEGRGSAYDSCARLYNAGVNPRSQPPIAANPAVWVISDGMAGNERQALSLADAMCLSAQVIRLQPRAPWRWFAPRLTAGARLGFPASLRRELHAPWPLMAMW